jgi:O-antigen/teichoic acid export membrane protein
VFHKIRTLAANLAVYGLGDLVTSIASFLLLPLYVRYLTPDDYGVISLLLTIEAVSKIVFRWGLDSAFMRLYYDCPDEASQQRLTSSIFWFLVGTNGLALAIALMFAPQLASHLFGVEHTTTLRLMLVNTFVVGFYFFPFNTLRILGKPPQFAALTFSRTVATLALRIFWIVFWRLGVLGIVLADLVVTAVFTGILWRWFTPLLRWRFSWGVMKDALRFGLPRLPHGIAHQITAVGDRYILSHYVALRDLGIYSIGASFGLAVKLFLAAFEYAWVPFCYEQAKEPDAKTTFSVVTTYTLAVLVLLAAGLSAIARDIVRLMTAPQFYEAARVIPWIAIGVVLQGFYQLTSIGINITKRTAYTPIVTGAAAATSLTANFLLVPRFGILGAAVSNVCAYGMLAGVGLRISQRLYPIPFEWDRIARIVVAGGLAYAAAQLVPSTLPVLVSGLLRGVIVVAVYVLVMLFSGFLRPHETARIRATIALVRQRRRPAGQVETAELAGEIITTVPNDAADAETPEEVPRHTAQLGSDHQRRL